MQPEQSQQSQQNGQEQKTSQSAANLGFINTMQEHLLQYKAGKNAPSKPQNAPQQEQTPKQDNSVEEKKEPNLAEEFTKFKTEIEGLMDSKLGDLKREIESALSEEESKETDATKTETTKTA